MKLLTLETAKNMKTKKAGVLTGVLFLAPHKTCGCANMCPYADGCQKTCLDTAGRLKFDTAERARLERTYWFLCDREGFIEALKSDISALVRKAGREGLKPAIRLNGLSDLRWEMTAPELFTTFPNVQFYDYTKNWGRYLRWLLNTRGQNDGLYSWPRNYHLTMSAGATWQDDGIAAALRYGGTLAVVFHKVPETYLGFPVIDGDLHDARWLDPKGVIVGLKAKGKAKGNGNGFVKG